MKLRSRRWPRRALAASLLLLNLVAGCKSAPWITYKSAEGRYSISLPRQPQLKEQEATLGDGTKVPQYLAMASDSSGGFYAVGYFDIGAASFSFDKARDGAVASGTLISEHSMSLGRYPGREFRFLAKDPQGNEGFVVAHFYLAGQRVYIVQYIVPKSAGQELPDQAAKYFDSFQVEGE